MMNDDSEIYNQPNSVAQLPPGATVFSSYTANTSWTSSSACGLGTGGSQLEFKLPLEQNSAALWHCQALKSHNFFFAQGGRGTGIQIRSF